MHTIHLRKKIESDTLHLPELQQLIGKPVEIMIVELPPATREELFAEAIHVPETPAERAAQRARFQAWRVDPRFERFWPSLDRYLTEDGDEDAAGNGAAKEPAA